MSALAAQAQGDDSLTIEERTSVIRDGEDFAVRVAVAAGPESRVRVDMHQNVSSRIALQQQLADPDADPGSVIVREDSGPIGQRRHVVVRVEAPTEAGVYPVSISLVDSEGDTTVRELTHVTKAFTSAEDFPPLDVVLVLDAREAADGAAADDAEASSEPGQVARRSAVQDPLAVAEQLAARFPALPLTFIVNPSELPPTRSNAFSEQHALIAPSYVPVDLEAALNAGLAAELERQAAAGTEAVLRWTGFQPTTSLAVLDKTPTPELDAWLRAEGVSGIFVDRAQLARLDPVAFPVTLLQPFLINGLGDLPAIEADPRLGNEVGLAEGAADVTAILTELAVLRADQPALPRAVAITIQLDRVEQAAATERLLEELADYQSVLRPVGLAQALAEVPLARDAGSRSGDALVRPVIAGRPTADLTDLASALAENRVVLDDYSRFVGRNSPNLDGLERLRLDALDVRRDPVTEQQRIAGSTADLRNRFAGVGVPNAQRITLTAREAELPVTVRRLVDHDVTVQLRFESEKLVFPEGEVLELTLTEPQTELNIPVVARTSGEFPVDLTVLSPSGEIVIAEGQLIVRSTAISGVGLILGIGALFVLTVWWIRLIRRERRERDSSVGTETAETADV